MTPDFSQNQSAAPGVQESVAVASIHRPTAAADGARSESPLRRGAHRDPAVAEEWQGGGSVRGLV